MMSLVIKFLFHFFYAQHASDINTSIIRSLRLLYYNAKNIHLYRTHANVVI